MPPLRPTFAADDGPEPQPTADVPTPNGVSAPSPTIVYTRPQTRLAARPDNGAALPGEIETLVPEPAAAPTSFPSLFGSSASPRPAPAIRSAVGRGDLDGMIAEHARANGVPVELVHRVVIRESRYNPRAIGHGGALGLMQIKHATARGLGYVGPASGLLDADTNLTYAVKYLAGAYRTAGGDFNRAVSYYARGYYYAAKRAGGYRSARRGRHRGSDRLAEPETLVAAQTEMR